MDNPYKVGDKVVVRPSADYPEPNRFAGLVGVVGRVHKTTVPYPVWVDFPDMPGNDQNDWPFDLDEIAPYSPAEGTATVENEK